MRSLLVLAVGLMWFTVGYKTALLVGTRPAGEGRGLRVPILPAPDGRPAASVRDCGRPAFYDWEAEGWA